jgi:hypothetical protein
VCSRNERPPQTGFSHSALQVFAGQIVGIREVSEKIWLVSFMNYDLGFFDSETGRGGVRAKPLRR